MGVKISVDKYVSELDDLIDLSPHYLSRVPFESRISPDIMQHLKIWRFYESKKNHDRVKSAPLPLFQLNENSFAFSQEEAYLVLLVYKSGSETNNDLSNFPQALWNVVQSSTDNLTPRGLANAFASNVDELDKISSDNFIQTTRRRKDGEDSARNGDGKPLKDPKNKKRGSQKSSQSAQQSKSGDSGQSGEMSYKYMIYVWSGKQASQNIRAQVLTKGYALNNYLQQAQDSGLNVLFSGGVIKNKKLQRGSIFMFEDVIEPGQLPNIQQAASQKKGYRTIGNDPSQVPNCSVEQALKAQESIFLLKWLYPEIQGKLYREKMGQVKHGKFPKFHEQFISDNSSTSTGSTTMRSVEPQVPTGQATGSTRTAQPVQSSSSGRGIQQKQGSGRQPGNQVVKPPVLQSQAYWERFECIDEIDEIELDEMIVSMQAGANRDIDESDDENIPQLNTGNDDADMNNEEKQVLMGETEPPHQYGEFNQDMLNEEIEDIDSDDEQLALAQYYQQQKEHQRIQSKKVPGLSLGGLGGGVGPMMGQPPALNINQPPVPGLSLGGDAASKIPALGGFSNLGGLDSSDQNTSGRMSSKRDGIGRLNLNKALDIQRELLDKADEMQRMKQGAPSGLAPIKDVDEQLYGSNPGPGGLNLGGIGAAPSGGLALPLAGSMSNIDAPPALRRGGDLESHQNIVKMSRGGTEEGGDANVIQEKLDEQFDWKGTSRKQYENVMFNQVCSQIIDGFIYLGSDNVAKDYDKLKENGITHVINCARDFSADYHASKGIKYLSFHLKDHVQENIESVFYEVIDFFESAKAAGGRVFVHCVQGISRSSTMIIAYLIFSQRMNQEEALALVRSRRQIANPNMAFLTQLILFYKRLYDTNFSSIKVIPRVFLVSSHQPEDPYKISCQMLLKNLFDGMAPQFKLDPRAMFIVQGPPSCPVYIWHGAQLPQGNVEPYMNQARKHVGILQQNEGANKSQPIVVKQGQEPAEFWQVLMNGRPQESDPYVETKDWTRLLINLETINYEKQAPMVEKMEQYIETVEEERKFKAKLYTYPNWQESCTVFDDEDLLNDALLVLCVKAQFGQGLPEGADRHKVYIWRGADFEEDEEDWIDENGAKVSSSSKEFVSRAMEQYWGCHRPEDQYNIAINEEFQGRESEEFLDQINDQF